MYLRRGGFDAYGRSLYSEGVPTPAQEKGHKNANDFWHGSTIHQILEREIYTGCLVS